MSNSQKTSTPAFTIIGNWATRSRLLKSEYLQLTDEDLKFELGKEEEYRVCYECKSFFHVKCIKSKIVNKWQCVKCSK